MNTTQPRLSRPAHLMARWSLLATLLAVVVIMLGAWTRLVDAGLGCPDWPGCYGFLTVPHDESRMAIAHARFPDTPVDVEKGWPEMIHRYAAGTLGLVVFGLAAYAFRHRRDGVPLRLPLFIAAFILLQGAFGMWTVSLKLWPQVVALHLLGGFDIPSWAIRTESGKSAKGYRKTDFDDTLSRYTPSQSVTPSQPNGHRSYSDSPSVTEESLVSYGSGIARESVPIVVEGFGAAA